MDKDVFRFYRIYGSSPNFGQSYEGLPDLRNREPLTKTTRRKQSNSLRSKKAPKPTIAKAPWE